MQTNSDQDEMDLENLKHTASDGTTLEKQREKLEMQLASIPTVNEEQRGQEEIPNYEHIDKDTGENDATIKAASIDDIHPENMPANGDRIHGPPTKVNTFTN